MPKPNSRAALVLLALLVLALAAAAAFTRGRLAAWQVAGLLGLATASTLTSLGRRLQLQNVLAVAGLISVLGGIVQFVGATTGIPFGPIVFTDNFGPQLFDRLPWLAPLLWLVMLLNCRGVARLLLRPWRKLHGYGFRVIGLTVGLMVLCDCALEPFATRVNRLWIWRVSGGVSMDWLGAPWVNFPGWAVTALLLLIAATPWLINKMPSRRRGPDYHPLVAWLALHLFLAVCLALHSLWLPAGLAFGACGVVGLFAWRNRA